jgi:hypothetical protein
MVSRLLLTAFLIANLSSQTSLASEVVDKADIDVSTLGNFSTVPIDVINEIGDEGVLEFARNLQGMNLKTVDLTTSKYWIEPTTKELLREQYPHIKWKI